MRYRASQRHSPRSRRVVALCVCLVVAGCAAPTDSEPPAAEVVEQDGSEAWDEVVMAHKALIAAYQMGDVEAFVAMLDPAPGTRIFHPVMRSRFSDIDEVRESLEVMFGRLGTADWTDVHTIVDIEGDVAWVSSNILVSSPNLEVDFVGRGTEIWTRREGKWKLVHGHWSEDPEIRPESLVRSGV